VLGKSIEGKNLENMHRRNEKWRGEGDFEEEPWGGDKERPRRGVRKKIQPKLPEKVKYNKNKTATTCAPDW